jgi:hypothetical protein
MKIRNASRFIALPACVLSIALLGVNQANAGWRDILRNGLFGDLSNSLGQFFTSIASGAEGWELLLSRDPCTTPNESPPEPGWCTNSDFLGSDGSISSIINNSIGDLKIPDLGGMRSNFQRRAKQAGETSDPLQPNPSLYGNELGNLGDRAATNLNARTVLSPDGQQRIQQEIEQGNEIVQSVLDNSDRAQSYDSTQDVVKALARIQAQQAILSNLAYASSVRERIDRQFTNVNLANISRSLDREARARESQSVIDSAFLFQLSSQNKLF